MPVHQVEEYYLHMNLNIEEKEKQEIEGVLEEEGYSNYEFQDGNTCLVVDDIADQSSGENLEERINGIIS
jgi:orotate phosphoribosyltransferase-like protein